MSVLRQLAVELERGKADEVARLTQRAIDEQLAPRVILDDGLLAGMAVIGEKFKAHQIFLPHVLLAAKAMYAGLDLLRPLMISDGNPSIGKVVLGTVHGDLHDIGKNLVGILLRGAGFEVIDLGKDVPAEKFLDAAEESGATIIGMSALLTTTMPVMKQVIDIAKERGLYGKIRFLVGGAPLSQDYAREIGADMYCYDGMNAVDSAKNLIASA